MRIARFTHHGQTRLGVVDEQDVVDLGAAAPGLPTDLGLLLAGDVEGLDVARRAAAGASASQRLPLADVRLEAPIVRPPKFLALGLNYADHLAETGRERPAFPVFFNKQSTCVTGPFDPIHVPRASSVVDYEGELGIVIGRHCRHVPIERAVEVVAGYCVVDDVSVRDWQQRSPTMTLGKSFDTHGPIGPWVVTPDELGDPHRLGIRTWINDRQVQDGTTADMLWDCWDQIATLSTVCTLEPGDVIATGTPAGVGIARTPPLLLEAGDVVRIEVDGIGAIENPVIDEPATTARLL